MFKEQKRIPWLGLSGILNAVFFLAIVYLLFGNKTEASVPEQNTTIVVQLAGEVANPGLYQLPQGSRLSELLDDAGGFTEEADQNAVNLAIILEDEKKYYVPSVSEAAANGKVNINTADAWELKTLSGIGDVRAADIIAYREENGPFTQIEDIMKIPGIGKGIFDDIKDDICV